MKKQKKPIGKNKKPAGAGVTLQKQTDAKGVWLILLGIFAISVLMRFILSYRTLNMPTVYIDEALYINIARSLFHDGQVMYRDQPISYVYLLYPIFLLPVFLLPASVNLYRAVQFYNAVLMSSSLFPAYLLGRKTGLSVERSILLGILTVLVPEFALSSFLTAESLYYPLMMWTFVLAAVLCRKEEKPAVPYLLLGALAGLLYFAKPVCIIFPCCFLVVDLILQVREGNLRRGMLCIASAAVMGVLIGGGYLLYSGLFGDVTVLNLYEKQLSQTTAESIPIMVQAFFYHIIAILFCCGGAFLAVPLFFPGAYSKSQVKLMAAAVLGVLASIIGVAVMVVPYNYTGSGWTCPVHLRYLMFYFPLLFVFFLSPAMQKKKVGKAAAAVLLGITLLTVFPSAFHFFNYQAGTFDSPGLNAYYTARISPALGVLLILLSAGFAVYFIFRMRKQGFTESLRTMACLVTVIFFCVNGICSYAARRTTELSDEVGAAEAAEIIAQESDALIVTTNLYDDFRGFLIDSHLHKPVQMVVMNDMLLNCTNTGGIYQSWEPLVQAPNTANNPTVDTDTILFDITTSDYVEFTDSVQTTSVGNYVIAKITPGEPFLKSAIASMDGYILQKEDMGSLLIFDPDILARGSVTLDITMQATGGEPCTVTFSCCGESQSVTVSQEWQDYTITLPIEKCEFFHFSITGTQSVAIGRYQTA